MEIIIIPLKDGAYTHPLTDLLIKTYSTHSVSLSYFVELIFLGTRSSKSDKERSLDEETSSDCDPQLPILLRIFFEKAQQEDQEFASNLNLNLNLMKNESPIKRRSSTRITYAMLELGISQSLLLAIQSSVGDLHSAVSRRTEIVTSLVDLLHRCVDM